MIVHHALDEVFRSWSRVAVLRTLLDTATGFTGNEIARVSGMQPRSALNALTTLETLGIVRRQRGGRDHIFTLNRDHYLVKHALLSLFESERQFPEDLRRDLAAMLHHDVVTAVIFGSVARREETPLSDLDICCIVKTKKQKDVVRDILGTNSKLFHQKFGIKISPIIFTVDEFKKREERQIVRDILDHGLLLTGKHPKALLDG